MSDCVDFTKISQRLNLDWELPPDALTTEQRETLEAHVERLLSAQLSPEEIEEPRAEDE